MTSRAAASQRASDIEADLGLEVDPLASAGSIFVLGGFAALQLKISGAIEKREERDAAAEILRKAEVLQLAGRLSPEEVARTREAARVAMDAYEDARRIGVVGGALLRIPDPSRSEAERRVLERPPSSAAPSASSSPATPPPPEQRPSDPLDGVRSALGLANRAPPETEQSLLPSGSRALTLKDVAIGLVFVLQLGWFALSLTDPMGTPNPLLSAALTSGGEAVDRMQERKAAASAEYAAMLRAAVENGEAPPLCATRRLDDPLGGCTTSATTAAAAALDSTAASSDAVSALASPSAARASQDAEADRTRGLDANRAWIRGKPTSADNLGL